MKPKSWFSGDPKKETPDPDYIPYEQAEKAVAAKLYSPNGLDEDYWKELVSAGLGVSFASVQHIMSTANVFDNKVMAKPHVPVPKKDLLLGTKVDLLVYDEVDTLTPLFSDKPQSTSMAESNYDAVLEWAKSIEPPKLSTGDAWRDLDIVLKSLGF